MVNWTFSSIMTVLVTHNLYAWSMLKCVCVKLFEVDKSELCLYGLSDYCEMRVKCERKCFPSLSARVLSFWATTSLFVRQFL